MQIGGRRKGERGCKENVRVEEKGEGRDGEAKEDAVKKEYVREAEKREERDGRET